MQTGQIPPKDACFQCYQPPVFYYSSAIVGKALASMGCTESAVEKLLQFLNCLYVILTLPLIYLILKRLNLSGMSRFIAFSLICFLPRHIFMSALHSNDGLTYLWGLALRVYSTRGYWPGPLVALCFPLGFHRNINRIREIHRSHRAADGRCSSGYTHHH